MRISLPALCFGKIPPKYCLSPSLLNSVLLSPSVVIVVHFQASPLIATLDIETFLFWVAVKNSLYFWLVFNLIRGVGVHAL